VKTVLAPVSVVVEISTIHEAHIRRAALQRHLNDAASLYVAKIVMGKIHDITKLGSLLDRHMGNH
jgi:hypothetical protein